MSLQVLDLGENPSLVLDDLTFDKVTDLEKLNLDNCKIEELPQSFLRNLSGIKYVNLKSNGLNKVPVNLFHQLENLNEIDLSDNEIREISDIFSGNGALEKVNLGDNWIEACGDLFHKLPSLKILDLSDNLIQVIAESDFKTSKSLRELLLAKNGINRIESNAFVHLSKLIILDLNVNGLISLNRSLRDLPELSTLLLYKNKLVEITQIEELNLPKLERLNLGANKLVNVHGAFSKLRRLANLTINGNSVKTLSRSTFPREIELKNIHASGNKWICDCRLLWLLDWMEGRYFSGFECAAPPHFAGINLSRLSSQNLTSWPDKCNHGCNCTCIPNDHEYFVNVDCSHQNLSKVPSLLPDETGKLHLQGNSLTNPVKLNIQAPGKLTYLDMETNELKEVNFDLPQTLETFKLAGNNLTKFLTYTIPPRVTNWTLSGNPWSCDCDALQFRKWLKKESDKIFDVDNTKCSDRGGKEALRGKIIIELSEYDICPERIRMYIFIGASLAMTTLTALSSHLIYSRYRYHLKVWLYSKGFKWLKKTDDDDETKIHDAYLAFSDEDIGLVRQFIIPELERKEPFYSLFVPQRSLKVGEFEIDEQMKEVTNSKRTIIILSKHYVANEFCMEIFRVAFATCLEERLYRIILIIVGEIPPVSELDQSLKVAIESTKCLRFGQKLFWEMVRFAMPDKEHAANDDGCESEADVPLLQTW